MVLKRVVYGVDKNPMAVELAKVALWLHSFTVGAPLSFLDHHLRCGDSILGTWIVDALATLGANKGFLPNLAVNRVESVAKVMDTIEGITDNDIAEVQQSKQGFGLITGATQPLEKFFSILSADRVLGVLEQKPIKAPVPPARPGAGAGDETLGLFLVPATKKKPKKEKSPEQYAKELERWRIQNRLFERGEALVAILDGQLGDPIAIAEGTISVRPDVGVLDGLEVDDDGIPVADLQGSFPGLGGNGLRRRMLAASVFDEAKDRDKLHTFFHWEIGFPNVWNNLLSAKPVGGFDAIIGNPPYVRHELLGDEVKRALKQGYKAFDGKADLYVYFYEQGLKLLKPGGRMGYVVTNKWLKAGYAEELRGIFAENAWLDFVADFGHAKHFFPGVDVFPSVLVARKPTSGELPPEEALICAIPCDEVPQKALSEAVSEATFPMPRLSFTRESWVLEPKPVMDLLAKFQNSGLSLTEYIGVRPVYGIKTGYNPAFLIDKSQKDFLVSQDPACAEIMKPYLRGQDLERWWSPPQELFMILLKSSGNFAWPWANAANNTDAETVFKKTYPSLFAHMKVHESSWDTLAKKNTGLRHREDQGRYWWELRACDYYEAFERDKLSYKVIQYHSCYSFDHQGRFGNDKTYFLPTDRTDVLAVLNSPAMWWQNWRRLPHMKDEALVPTSSLIESATVPVFASKDQDEISTKVGEMMLLQQSIYQSRIAVLDWLRFEHGLEKNGVTLAQPHNLEGDAFVAAVRKALPKSQKITAAAIADLRREYADTVQPARDAAQQALVLERQLSDVVNEAYGLTPDDIELMWKTAPPRMPFQP
jgi:hypothetical protein